MPCMLKFGAFTVASQSSVIHNLSLLDAAAVVVGHPEEHQGPARDGEDIV